MIEDEDAGGERPADQALLGSGAAGAAPGRGRDAVGGAVAGRAHVLSGPGGTEPDDDESSGAAGRLCGYRGCRAALPEVAGPGNRAKYCQDDKRWGPKALTCKQAAAALENVASLAGPAALDDPSVAALGEHVDRVLGPLSQLAEVLVVVRGDLDTAVSTAQRDRDTALARAVEADGRADAAALRTRAAEQLAEDAEDAAAAASRLRAAAEAERDRAGEAARRAERAQAVAEARLVDAQDTATRADRRSVASGERAEYLEQQLAGSRAELVSTREALEEERQRAGAETERANQAITDAAAHRDELRRQFDERAEQLRTEHRTALEDAHARHAQELTALRDAADRSVAQVREQAEQARRAETERHSGDTVVLHQRIGGLTQQLRAVRGSLSTALSAGDDADRQQRLSALLAEDPWDLDIGGD